MFKNLRRNIAFIAAAVMLATVIPAGTVQGASATAKTVAKKPATISVIENIKKTVEVDAVVTMPTTVTAVMSDKTKKNVAVKWDKTLNSDVDGTYTAKGTVAGYARPVIFTLTVKAPKMGTIQIPKVTDSTLKKPTDIKLGTGKGTISEGNQGKELDKTLLSVYWTLQSNEADEYTVRIYDQYKRIVYNGGTVLNQEDFGKKQGNFMLHLKKTKNLTITAITITPVKTTEEGRMTGDSTKNGIGETAVFQCSVKVVSKAGKQMIMSVKPNQSNKDAYDFSFSEKVEPYKYLDLRSDYRFFGSDCYGFGLRGDFSGKDGTVSITYVNSQEYKEMYESLSAKLSLLVYSNAVIESGNKGSFTVTQYPVLYKDNPRAKAAKAFDGVYANGSKKVIISTKGPGVEFFSGDIHVVTDFNNNIFACRSTVFDGNKKITDTTENAKGPMVTMEFVLDGDTIHYTRTFHQENNRVEKLDLKRTKEDALTAYQKYYKLLSTK